MLSNKMLSESQKVEPKYASLRSRIISEGEDVNFKLIDNVLYKVEKIFDQMSFKLCIPSFIALDILTNEHLKNNQHMWIKALTDRSILNVIPLTFTRKPPE